MGAEIIKRQLSGDSPTSAAMFDHHGDNSSHRPRSTYQGARNNVGQTSIDKDDWDPWRTDGRDGAHEDHANENRNVVSRNTNEHCDENDDGDGYEDAATILEHANAIIDRYSNPRSKESSQPSASLATKKSEKQNDDTWRNKTSSYNCLVQRVSEMDDTSFASSSVGNGYLPKNLISSFGCGGLIPTTATTDLETKNTGTNSGEDMETSTLDFLMSLHQEEKNLNSILNSVEGRQRNLCSHSHALFSPDSPSKLCSSEPASKRPLVTATTAPLANMISPRSSVHEELMENPAYRHALKAGTLWQSLCSQHVRFPAVWWDGQKPVGPPLGSSKKLSKPWAYLGRHRVQGDYKLNSVIGNRGSSGRILLHLVVRDVVSGEPTEDIACGCYHPNARGVRASPNFNPRIEDCRDVWMAHRRRVQEQVPVHEALDNNSDGDDDGDNEHSWTTTESLLRHQNKGRVYASPLGAQGGKSSVTNENLKVVFGSKPPVYTVFVMESELFEVFQNQLDGSIPASVALLRHYLRYQIGKQK